MPVAVFCLFLVFQKIHIKWSPNAAKLFDDFFWKETDPGSFGGAAEEPQGPHKPPGRATPPGVPWCLVGPLWHLFAWLQCWKILYIQKPPKVNLDEFLRHRKPLYLHDLIYSPFLAPCRRGESITRGHLHHPGGLHDEEGVVHPRGWGYVLVAMC